MWDRNDALGGQQASKQYLVIPDRAKFSTSTMSALVMIDIFAGTRRQSVIFLSPPKSLGNHHSFPTCCSSDDLRHMSPITTRKVASSEVLQIAKQADARIVSTHEACMRMGLSFREPLFVQNMQSYVCPHKYPSYRLKYFLCLKKTTKATLPVQNMLLHFCPRLRMHIEVQFF